MHDETKVQAIIAWLIANKVKDLTSSPGVGEMLLESIYHRPVEFYNWVGAKLAMWANDIGITFHLEITPDQFSIIAKHVTETFRREILPHEPEFTLVLVPAK